MLAASRERIRTRAFRGALVVVALIFALWAMRVWTEPRYNGRTVRSWIEQAPWDTSSNSETQEALRYFGERAIPYLIDATVRPLKWQQGFLAKIPRRYLANFLDIDEQMLIRRTAVWRLQQLVEDENETNEMSGQTSYPIAERLIPIWKRELRHNPSSEILVSLESFGGRMTNFVDEVRQVFLKLDPSRDEWSHASATLAETRGPALVPLFLGFTTLTNTDEVRSRALTAAGRNGFANDQVAQAVRDALSSTNVYLAASALKAATLLNLCSTEALELIERRQNSATVYERRTFEVFEPILRWRHDPADQSSINRIEANLSAEAKPFVRLTTIDTLGTLGSVAKPFLPALARMVREQDAGFRTRATQAIRRIDRK